MYCHLFSEEVMNNKGRETYGEGFSTVDLIIKVACSVEKGI